ncbi:SIS domain-containing protein [Bacteroides sp.]|uniref:SIS domain-containing protein n=1 Tax=Bacteroides sp. TaxID=29523 RepID=UPI002587F6B0|nr:SIS domain-containing protein [Bacteroides sp.]
MNSVIEENFKEAMEVLDKFSKPENFASIKNAAEIMISALKNGNTIFSCGNGGSLCDATHFAEELTARFRKNRKALAAVAINDPAFLTCVANDFDYNQVYSRFLEACACEGDVLLAISTSGNSDNICQACLTAKVMGVKVISLTGKDGGELSKISDVDIRAPKTPYSDRAQEIHIKVIHTLVQLIEIGLGLA